MGGGVCVQTLVPPLERTEGRGGRCQSGSGLEPLASRGWPALPKTAPLDGTTGVGNSADLARGRTGYCVFASTGGGKKLH